MSLQQKIQGHWIRRWIKAPGFEDHTTRVHWAQAGLGYADVRIPLQRPDLSKANALADLSADALAVLAQADGFAGHVTLDGTTCTWHREASFHGTPDVPDVGTISFDATGRMIETGVLSEYTELWECDNSDTPQIIRLSGSAYAGCIVTIGEACIIGIGKTGKPSTKSLLSDLHNGHVPQGIEDIFDGIHAVGKWSERSVIADLATQPFAEGNPVLTRDGSSLIWHATGFDGACSDVVLHTDAVIA